MNQELTFDPSFNQLRQCVLINIIDENVLEEMETFGVTLTSTDPDISIRPNSNTVVMIRNDDGTYHRATQLT